MRLAGGCALVLAVSLSGCAAPPLTGVSDTGANVHFTVPRGWDQISDAALSSELQTETGSSGGGWKAAYEAGRKPRAGDFLSFATTQPFVFAEYGTLNAAASRTMSDEVLRDFFLPVTSAARQNAAGQGFPLTGFRHIADQPLTPGQGVHGIRETYDYTLEGNADTFASYVLTNAGHTVVFILVVHCTTTCYSKYQTEIERVMSSVTVSGFGQPRSPWAGLVGR